MEDDAGQSGKGRSRIRRVLGWTLKIFAVIVVVALGFYYGQKSRAKTTGVDYSTIFAEIPPE